MEHISSVKDGAIVMFKGSTEFWMKVCDSNGHGGVVKLSSGLYVSISDLWKYGLNKQAEIIASNLNELYFGEDE